MQSWVAVEATLDSANVLSHSNYGLKTTTVYKATATYSYYYNQKLYQGSCIGIHQGYDNVGDWQTRVLDDMEQMHPLRVWVNPDEPSESIFDRTIRWRLFSLTMIFVLIFGGVGFLGILPALRKDEGALELSSRNQIKPDWRKSHIQSDNQIWGIWYVTLTACLFSFGIIFPIIDEWDRGNSIAFIGLLFPLGSLALFVKTVRMTTAWRLLGVMPLSLTHFPAVMGRDINGTLTLNHCLPEGTLAGANLSCIALNQRHFGRGTRTERVVIWNEQHLLQCDSKLGSHELKFSFHPPESLPGADELNLEWKLKVRVKCDAPGIDHIRIYTIPVTRA